MNKTAKSKLYYGFISFEGRYTLYTKSVQNAYNNFEYLENQLCLP